MGPSMVVTRPGDKGIGQVFAWPCAVETPFLGPLLPVYISFSSLIS